MENYSDQLARSVSTRICHDIISPLGAISNGLELLSLYGGETGPEVDLINRSVASASARLRAFRIAFGQAPAGSEIEGEELQQVVAALDDARLTLSLRITETTILRTQAKSLLLGLLCLETALPAGGTLRLELRDGGAFLVATPARAPRYEGDCWTLLEKGGAVVAPTPNPARVQFTLLALHQQETGRPARLGWSESLIELSL